MSYTKAVVKEMFQGHGELYPHQAHFVKVVRDCIEEELVFTSEMVHRRLARQYGHTGVYTTFLKVLVEQDFLIEEAPGIYHASALLECFLE